ncbi:MAG: hypothetical protein WC628_05225 [Candidatus Omnitrophota bacterium]
MAELAYAKKSIAWYDNLAYCVGLLTSDGNLSKDGRHITLVSKDKEVIKTFKDCLRLSNRIAVKNSGFNKSGSYYYLQFGDTKLYRWLNSIGIHQNKSKTISSLRIPNKYFFHFLRGLLDGDGCITSFKHPESKHCQIRVKFCSASKDFIHWLDSKIYKLLSIKGSIQSLPRIFELIYYKSDSIKLLKRIYRKAFVFLERKRDKARSLLGGGWCNWQTREA